MKSDFFALFPSSSAVLVLERRCHTAMKPLCIQMSVFPYRHKQLHPCFAIISALSINYLFNELWLFSVLHTRKPWSFNFCSFCRIHVMFKVCACMVHILTQKLWICTVTAQGYCWTQAIFRTPIVDCPANTDIIIFS